jgi:hypothetical protein
MIGVLVKHPEWFGPLFAELDRRGLPYATSTPISCVYDPGGDFICLPAGDQPPEPRGISARHYLAYLDRLAVLSQWKRPGQAGPVGGEAHL